MELALIQRIQSTDVKSKMRGRKLRSGEYRQGMLKRKAVRKWQGVRISLLYKNHEGADGTRRVCCTVFWTQLEST